MIMSERVVTCPCYQADLNKLVKFRDKINKRSFTLKDALRVCVEFADSHGALK